MKPLDAAIDNFLSVRSGGGGPGLLAQKRRVGGGGAACSDSEQLQNMNAPFERLAPTSPACGGRPAPSFKWHTSPAKTYGFKELTERCGYDPRETSVYWIEKRANALRRKWKKHGQHMRGETTAPKPRTRPKPDAITDENQKPVIKRFKPGTIDYNSVWPPVKLPEGPPEIIGVHAQENTTEIVPVKPRGERRLCPPQPLPIKSGKPSQVAAACLPLPTLAQHHPDQQIAAQSRAFAACMLSAGQSISARSPIEGAAASRKLRDNLLMTAPTDVGVLSRFEYPAFEGKRDVREPIRSTFMYISKEKLAKERSKTYDLRRSR